VRDQWYADNRDLVKWAALVHLAESYGIRRIIQVAYYRPNNSDLTLKTTAGQVSFPGPVLEHFRNLDQIKGLAAATGLRIDVYKEPFECDEALATREAVGDHYTRQLVAELSESDRDALIAFLDPDTGIAPTRAGLEHVTPEEIRAIYDGLRAGDALVLYQHARRKGGWLEATRQAFARAVGAPEEDVETVTCPDLAADVAFYAIQRQSR